MIMVMNNGKFSYKPVNKKQLTGENMPGDLDAWEYFGTDPNELLTYSYEMLSQRSTTL